MNTPIQAQAGVEPERLQFFDKETGEIRTNHEYFVLRGEVWRDNYNTYESQAAVIGFDDCIVRVPEIGWRLASLASEREEVGRLRADLETMRDALVVARNQVTLLGGDPTKYPNGCEPDEIQAGVLEIIDAALNSQGEKQ